MLALNAEQEQALIAKLFEKISPLLPQHIRDNVKPALRDLVDNEDSVFVFLCFCFCFFIEIGSKLNKIPWELLLKKC